MIITALRTDRVSPGSVTLLELLDEHVSELPDYSVLAITSKIVSLCEGSVVPADETSRQELVKARSQYYVPAELSRYGFHYTITNNTLIPMCGIDLSNGDGHYVLWPKDSQATANLARAHLAKKFSRTHIGVVITDSTSQPLRRGTSGIALAHSGFKALRDYVGTDDLFGRPYNVTQANISGGLAAAAVLAMGEGNERTPLCVISGLDAVEFQDHDPTAAELADIRITLQDDLFAPFLTAVDWQKGGD